MAGILIATIGKRDPVSEGEATAPLRAAQRLRPDGAVLLATEAVLGQAEATREAILAELPGCQIVIEVAERLLPGVPNLPVRIKELMFVGRSLLHRHPELREPNAKVDVCFSSGTPQESVALTLVARSLLPRARHFQALNPRDIASGTDPFEEFDPDVLVHLEARNRVFECLEAGDATGALAAGEQLRGIRTPPWNAKALEVALVVARALEMIGGYQRDGLRHVQFPQHQGLGAPAVERIRAFVQWFQRCQKEDLAWGAELSAHALRLCQRGNPTVAVIAAAIAGEVLASAALRAHGLDPDFLDPDRVPEPLRERLKPASDAKRFRIEGSQDRSALLAAISKPYRAAVDERGLDGLREQVAHARNRAVHQGSPVGSHVSDRAIRYLDELARATAAPIPSEAPTAPAGLRQLASELQALQ
jgi:hypothetical protein